MPNLLHDMQKIWPYYRIQIFHVTVPLKGLPIPQLTNELSPLTECPLTMSYYWPPLRTPDILSTMLPSPAGPLSTARLSLPPGCPPAAVHPTHFGANRWTGRWTGHGGGEVIIHGRPDEGGAIGPDARWSSCNLEISVWKEKITIMWWPTLIGSISRYSHKLIIVRCGDNCSENSTLLAELQIWMGVEGGGAIDLVI